MGLYDTPEGQLAAAVFEFIDYMKEHLPLNIKNVETFARGVDRYVLKIEQRYQEYYETSDESIEEKKKVSVLIDRITAGTRRMVDEVRKNQNLFKPEKPTHRYEANG